MSRLPDALREHLLHPCGAGEPAGGHDRRGEARNAACRDHLVLYLALEDGALEDGALEDEGRAGARVARAGFRATGCPATLAYGSLAAELLPGQPADASLPASLRAALVAAHGEPAALHRHALALVEEALRAALRERPGP